MRKLLLLIAVLALVCAAAAAAYVGFRPHAAPDVARSTSRGQDFTLLERGRYLTTLADCAACHTKSDTQPFAGGRAIETPFGVLLAPNITPDNETGIGSWTDAEFDDVLRRGIGRGGYHIYPAMPYPSYTKMTRDEVLAIRTFLSTVAPVEHRVEVNQLPFPLNIRAAMIAWNGLFFTPGEFVPDPSRSAESNRGASLVEGAAHCGACHTPKSVFGSDDKNKALEGGLLQGWFAPNITNDERRGLGRWAPEDVVEYLKTGHNRWAGATGPMSEVVSLSTSHLTDADLRAIATYLKSQPGHPDDTAPAPASDPRMAAGAAIYRDTCSACHTPDGRGVPRLFPALAGAPAVQSDDATTLVRVILRGARSVATGAAPTGPAMPAFGWQLDDDQVASVTTFIRNGWGNAAPAVTTDQVRSQRAALAKRSD